MEKLAKFSNSEFGELNILEIDGKPYFPSTACARILGYSHPENAIQQHCRYSLKWRVPHPQSPKKTIEMNFIPEGDLYRLIVHSRLPAAERFEKWVFDEVLPSIRQRGGYAPDMTQMIREEVRSVLQEVIGGAIRPDKVGEHHERVKRHGRKMGIIANLDAPIRQEIDLMLESRKYTYRDICQTLECDYGIYISKSALGRYAQQDEEGQEEPSSTARGMYLRLEDIQTLIRLLLPR